MKALSIKQPWASLIAHGIKNIENRTWKTHFRGKIYIHASASKVKLNVMKILFDKDVLDKISDEKYQYLLCDDTRSAIIGEVEIVDCVTNHPSVWAEKCKEGEKPIYNWVLANPILYDKPILNVKGKLSFWEFRNLVECRCCTKKEIDAEMRICEICENQFCEDCQASFNQFSQIDYDCCQDCENVDVRD